MNKRKVLILNGVDSLGLEISKLYLKNNFIVLFQYQKINIDIKKIKKKFGKNFILIKFSFLNTEKKINKFLNLKQIKDCDILINTIDHLKSKNYKSLNFSDITKSLKVNFYPSFYLTKILGPLMSKRKWGRIINLSAAESKYSKQTDYLPYFLSKHLFEFFPNEHNTWAKNNVLINTIKVTGKNIKNLSPIVYFLASDQNTYISNQVIDMTSGD